MNLAPVARLVGYAHFGIAGAMALPFAFALDASRPEMVAYGVGGLVSAFAGAICLALNLGFSQRVNTRNNLRELLLSLMLFWAVGPISAAVPFWLLGSSFGESWFEAVSALTTTGAWLSDPAARASDAGMVYRASLQWGGGLISLATAAAVFVRPEFLGVAPLAPPFARGESGSYLRSFDRAVRTFFPIFAVLSLLGAGALILLEVPAAQAMTMAMSFAASGGFVPVAGGFEAFDPSVQLACAVLMILGAINFVVLASLALGRTSQIRSGKDQETKTFLILIPVIAVIFWLSAGAGDLDKLVPQAFNAISMLSTNGPTLGEHPDLTPVLVTAMIGGAAVSTAGGIKLLRWLITFRRTGEELWKLTNPGAVSRNRPSASEMGVWIHALAFTMLTAALVLTTAFFGYSLEVSAAAAAAVISNTGPLLAIAPGMAGDYFVFDPILRLVFGIGMIAGRLELVVMLVILNRRFWQG